MKEAAATAAITHSLSLIDKSELRRDARRPILAQRPAKNEPKFVARSPKRLCHSQNPHSSHVILQVSPSRKAAAFFCRSACEVGVYA